MLPIIVTGPTAPQQPINLMVPVFSTETAVIEWMVYTIAYTPESYVVHYGTSRDSLLFTSVTVTSGNDFSFANLHFSTQLTFLSSNTHYYYKVIATNTVNSTESSVEEFTTQNDAESDNTSTIIGGVVAGVIVIVIVVSLTVIVVVWLVITAVRQKKPQIPCASSQRDLSKRIKLTHVTMSENQESADAHYKTVQEAHEYEIAVGKCAAYGVVGHHSQSTEHAASAEEHVYESVIATDDL